MSEKMQGYFFCPNCGLQMPRKALACQECGSDENTGWSEDTMYDGLDLPETEPSVLRPSRSLFKKRYFLSIVAIIVILAFLWIYLI